jgi:uncharacterized protein involved in exopolysaccharide biosynthesis
LRKLRSSLKLAEAKVEEVKAKETLASATKQAPKAAPATAEKNKEDEEAEMVKQAECCIIL